MNASDALVVTADVVEPCKHSLINPDNFTACGRGDDDKNDDDGDDDNNDDDDGNDDDGKGDDDDANDDDEKRKDTAKKTEPKQKLLGDPAEVV